MADTTLDSGAAAIARESLTASAFEYADKQVNFSVTHPYPVASQPAPATVNYYDMYRRMQGIGPTVQQKPQAPMNNKGWSVAPAASGTGPTRESAYAMAGDLARNWGLGSEGAAYFQSLIQQYGTLDPDVLLSEFRQSDIYAKRFPAVAMMRQQGKSVYNEAEMISLERSYSQGLKNAGVPQGFYDSPEDFAKWMANDVSPSEVSERAQMAVDTAKNLPPEVQQAFQDFYGIGKGDLAAYFLDPKKGKDFLERRYKAAQIGGEALMQGLDYGKEASMDAARAGVTAREARGAMNAAGMEADEMKVLGAIDNKTVTDRGLVNEQLGIANPKVVERNRQLRSRERARFAGQGAGTETFGAGSSGSF